jgi:hypothetical protein
LSAAVWSYNVPVSGQPFQAVFVTVINDFFKCANLVPKYFICKAECKYVSEVFQWHN